MTPLLNDKEAGEGKLYAGLWREEPELEEENGGEERLSAKLYKAALRQASVLSDTLSQWQAHSWEVPEKTMLANVWDGESVMHEICSEMRFQDPMFLQIIKLENLLCF